MFTPRMEVALGVKSVAFQECASLSSALELLSKHWKKRSVICHPDKGGDAEIMKELNSQYDLAKAAIELHFMKGAGNTSSFSGQELIICCWVCKQLLRLRTGPCNFHCTRCFTYLSSTDPRCNLYATTSMQSRPKPRNQWQKPWQPPTQPQPPRRPTSRTVPPRSPQWQTRTRPPTQPQSKHRPVVSAKRRSNEDRLRVDRENEIRARARLESKGDLDLYARLVAERIEDSRKRAQT